MLGGPLSTQLVLDLKDRLRARADTPVVTVCGSRGKPDRSLTGAELERSAVAIASALRAAFDPAAGPLALVMPCGVDFVETLFGGLYAGYTVAPLALPRGPVQADRFNAIIDDCKPVAILCAGGWADRVIEARSTSHSPVPVLDIADLQTVTPTPSFVESGGARPVILQYTSGSTRAPRGVMLSAEAILANASLTARTWGWDADSRVASWLPHFHDMGLMSILYPILNNGVTFLMDPLHMIQRPERWLRLISDKRITISGGPAFAFAHVMSEVTEEQRRGLDLSSWKDAFCGAEPVPAELMSAFRTRFAPHGLDPKALFGSYGLAEYALMVCGGQGDDAPPPSPPPGCERVEPCRIDDEVRDFVRIVDPGTRMPQPDGLPGEVWLSGPSRASGYLNDIEETRAVFGARLADDEGGEPWLRTGDLAVRQGGHLYVIGRLKDLIFVNGRKIPAPEIESLAAQQDPGLNGMAAAALMPDELVSGQAVLLIELKRRAKILDEGETRARIRRAVMGAWSIDLVDVRFVPAGSLPRTSSGKVQRRLVAETYRRESMDATA